MKTSSGMVPCSSGVQFNLSTGRFAVMGDYFWSFANERTCEVTRLCDISSQVRALRVATYSASGTLEDKTNDGVARRPHGLDLESGGFPN